MASKRTATDLSDSEPEDSPKRQRYTFNIITSTTQSTNLQSLENIYLDTIDRKLLDFDFEKVCSVTLSNVNVYGCLRCGKYFQGRGKSSPAYFHSVDDDHHVFVNFNTLKVYLLPENTIVDSPLLDDIKYSVNPTYTRADLKNLGKTQVKDLNGNNYTPGFIGLNNIKANDYANVVLLLLSHVKMVRDFCLLSENDKLINKLELNKRFTIFVKKLWSPRLFKNHISPHELLQHIGVLSNKKFTLSEQKSPRDFLLYLLNTLHRSFTDSSSRSTVFTNAFQGKLQIQSQTLTTDPITDQPTPSTECTTISSKFWILTLDLPSVSLFKTKSGLHEIPQIRLEKLMEKYDGTTETINSGKIQKISIVKYPAFLIFDFSRFKDKNLGIELQVKDRNQTIVQFPLEMDLEDGKVRYRLIGNVVHDLVQSDELDKDDKSLWKVQLRNGEEWVEIQDLSVKKKEAAYMFLGETCLQLWERIK